MPFFQNFRVLTNFLSGIGMVFLFFHCFIFYYFVNFSIYYFKIWLVKLNWVWICILTVTIGTRKKIQGQFIIFSLFPLWIKRSSRINSKIERWLIPQIGKSKSKRPFKGDMKGVKTKPFTKTGELVFKQTIYCFYFSLFESKKHERKKINQRGTIDYHEKLKFITHI